MPNHLILKDYYLSLTPKYERLSDSLLVMLKALRDKYKITFSSYDTARHKDFDSLLNKLAQRVNTTDDKTNPYNPLIRSVLIKGRRDDFSQSLSYLKDILGIRIVCVYENDVKKLLQGLKDLRDNGDIEFSDDDVKNFIDNKPSSDDGYKGIHVVAGIGKERKKLFEYHDLDGLKVEIQLKTILFDGWANVSHELLYKSKIPQSCYQRLRIDGLHDRMIGTSVQLVTIDQHFNDIKSEIESIINKQLSKR